MVNKMQNKVYCYLLALVFSCSFPAIVQASCIEENFTDLSGEYQLSKETCTESSTSQVSISLTLRDGEGNWLISGGGFKARDTEANAICGFGTTEAELLITPQIEPAPGYPLPVNVGLATCFDSNGNIQQKAIGVFSTQNGYVPYALLLVPAS